MDGRICVVTGATSGIGREIARALAAAGDHVAVVCRDRGRGEAVAAELDAAAGRPAASVHLADLSRQADVRRVAGELLVRCPRIDVLVNNAGVVNLAHATTDDGIETVFATNHLAYFLLTLLLLPRLRASAPARIVNVASEAHRFGRLDLDDLGQAGSYRAMRVYGTSKLSNILFTYELARRLEGSGVTVNCLHPGAVATGLGHNNGRWAILATRLLAPFFRTPRQGADTAIWLASAPEAAGEHGRYFVRRRAKRTSRPTYDRALAARLWDVSAALCRVDPSVA
ncbi:MAG: SDR family oxidoreductase [bacterium]|nr:SDR family oxidoreductase [bacterium]